MCFICLTSTKTHTLNGASKIDGIDARLHVSSYCCHSHSPWRHRLVCNMKIVFFSSFHSNVLCFVFLLGYRISVSQSFRKNVSVCSIDWWLIYSFMFSWFVIAKCYMVCMSASMSSFVAHALRWGNELWSKRQLLNINLLLKILSAPKP